MNQFITLARSLIDFVPFLAKWLGSEQEEKVVAKVIDVAESVTGKNDPVSILAALRENPPLLTEFQGILSKLDYELKMTELKDRENARFRDIALAQAGRSNMRGDIMVIAAAFGLIFCLITITLYRSSLPGEAVGIISTIAGIFGSCLKDAYAFEFGSSRGSKIKDTKLSALFLGSPWRG